MIRANREEFVIYLEEIGKERLSGGDTGAVDSQSSI